MPKVSFPDTFPSQELQECYQIVANKQLMEKQETFALNAWNIQGYILKVTLEDSLSAHNDPEFNNVDRQIDQFVQETQTNYLNANARQELTSGELGGYLTQYLPILLQLLAGFRNRRKNPQ